MKKILVLSLLALACAGCSTTTPNINQNGWPRMPSESAILFVETPAISYLRTN